MSHLDSWGIIAGHLAEVPARIAKRWRRVRDLRDAWSGPLGAGDCPGVGPCPQHGTPVSELAEAMLPKPRPPRGSLAGLLHRAHRPASGGGVWKTASCCCGNCGPGDTRGATRSSWSTCVPAGGGVSPKRRCGLRQHREKKPRWTGAVCRTSVRTGSDAASGCS